MGDTAALRKLPDQSGEKRQKPSRPIEEMVSWSGLVPAGMASFLDRVNPWDRRALRTVVVRFAEVRELANTAQLLHQVLERGPHRAASGRWSFDELMSFKEKAHQSIRQLHRQINRVADEARIFIHRQKPSGREPRHD